MNIQPLDIQEVIRGRMTRHINDLRLQLERERSQHLTSLREQKARVEFLIAIFEAENKL